MSKLYQLDVEVGGVSEEDLRKVIATGNTALFVGLKIRVDLIEAICDTIASEWNRNVESDSGQEA